MDGWEEAVSGFFQFFRRSRFFKNGPTRIRNVGFKESVLIFADIQLVALSRPFSKTNFYLLSLKNVERRKIREKEEKKRN